MRIKKNRLIGCLALAALPLLSLGGCIKEETELAKVDGISYEDGILSFNKVDDAAGYDITFTHKGEVVYTDRIGGTSIDVESLGLEGNVTLTVNAYAGDVKGPQSTYDFAVLTAFSEVVFEAEDNLYNFGTGKAISNFRNNTLASKGAYVGGIDDAGSQVSLFARKTGGDISQEITFANATSLINKEFIFTAESDSMDVGFKFSDNAVAGETLVFDDFMLEEVQREKLQSVSDEELKLYSNKFVKSIAMPEGIKEGEEVIVSVKYRNYAGSALFVNVNRNSELFGGVVASNTSKNSLSGCGVLEIPYVFEKDGDTLQLEFTGNKMYIGEIAIYRAAQYMFR